MPEDMPEYMPEDMPQDMSEYMPEDMSDRMPEDLPVTKCINVMVGITRSKVFFFEGGGYPKQIQAYGDMYHNSNGWRSNSGVVFFPRALDD